VKNRGIKVEEYNTRSNFMNKQEASNRIKQIVMEIRRAAYDRDYITIGKLNAEEKDIKKKFPDVQDTLDFFDFFKKTT